MKSQGVFTRELLALTGNSQLGDAALVSIGDVVRLSRYGVDPEVGNFEPVRPGTMIPLRDGESPDEALKRIATEAPPAGRSTGFRLGAKSLNELKSVNPDLVKCTSLALSVYSRIDFTVYDGIRTIEEQRRYVAAGTSKTMKSKHLDGLAVDLVPIIGGIPKWDWTGCYEIAMAMDKAATQLGIADRITWGGAWDRTLDQYGGNASAYIQAVEEYKKRHPGPDFIDGPHFEIQGPRV